MVNLLGVSLGSASRRHSSPDSSDETFLITKMARLNPIPIVTPPVMFKLFRRRETPWEVVDSEAVETVPMFYDDEGA